jgi:UDPglucose--hexose-1-phosphate uridylyltransferase
MAGIKFESEKSEAEFLNPFKDFAVERQVVEVRKDPLTGDTSVYNPVFKDKAKIFFGDTDPALIESLARDTANTCIFCGDKPEKTTPKYLPGLIPWGRIQEGDSVLFSNLFPIGKYHSVIVLGKKHFLTLPEFTPALLETGLRAAQKFLIALSLWDEESGYSVLSSNYLFPAGASIVHPHLQMLATPIAYSYQARLIKAASLYYGSNRSSYFTNLIYEERRSGERYVNQIGPWHWMASYSPMGNNEFTAIHETESDYAFLPERALGDLAKGISRVLLLYEKLGHLAFNFALYSVRGGDEEGFRLVLKIISRQNLYPNYRNDDYFLQKMLQSELIIISPEELADMLRKVPA